MAQLFGPRHHCTVKTGHLHTTVLRGKRGVHIHIDGGIAAFIIASLVADSAFVLQRTRDTRAARKYPEQRAAHSFDDIARDLNG